MTQTIISSPADLTTERLTGLLNDRFGGEARVAALSHVPVGFGLLSDSLRFSIDYAGVPPDDYPKSVVGKFSPADLGIRANGRQLGVYASEVGFYQEIADTVAVRRPDCLYAAVDAMGSASGLIMEDLGPARAGDQFNGCTIAEARLVMVQAAALHAPRWNDITAVRPWMLYQQQVVRSALANFDGMVATFIERLGPGLTAREIAVVERYGREAVTFYDHRSANRTIVHSDLRLDNILFDALGGAVPCAVLDWQSIMPGSGALDIGFFLSTSLAPEDRRAHEKDLLALYLDTLEAHGVRDYSAQALWQDYRLFAYQALLTAVSASYSAKQTERADQLFTQMARNGVVIMEDLGSFEALAAV